MDILIGCRECPGDARFPSARRRSSGGLLGRCDACAALYRLFGGTLSLIEPPALAPATAAVGRWRFRSLVQSERRATGGAPA